MGFKEAKTVEQWRDEIDRDAAGGRGKFRILPREILNSRAFAALGGSGTIVVLAVLNKLEFERNGKRYKKGVRTGHSVLRNNGEFRLTGNELVARGLSRSTATRARFKAWELGFFDVIESGTVHHAGRYRYSERWRNFPDGDYRPVGQLPPGRNVYPENGFRKAEDDESGMMVELGKVVIFPVARLTDDR